MNVLVECRYNGTVRDAFLTHGHNALSCDLLPADGPGPQYRGNVRDIISEGWDVMAAHDPAPLRDKVDFFK